MGDACIARVDLPRMLMQCKYVSSSVKVCEERERRGRRPYK